jgi:hypothetical protein
MRARAEVALAVRPRPEVRQVLALALFEHVGGLRRVADDLACLLAVGEMVVEVLDQVLCDAVERIRHPGQPLGVGPAEPRERLAPVDLPFVDADTRRQGGAVHSSPSLVVDFDCIIRHGSGYPVDANSASPETEVRFRHDRSAGRGLPRPSRGGAWPTAGGVSAAGAPVRPEGDGGWPGSRSDGARRVPGCGATDGDGPAVERTRASGAIGSRPWVASRTGR